MFYSLFKEKCPHRPEAGRLFQPKICGLLQAQTGWDVSESGCL